MQETSVIALICNAVLQMLVTDHKLYSKLAGCQDLLHLNFP